MDWTLAVAFYFVTWWLTLFLVLPFGVRTQSEDGTVVPGTPESAPARARIGKIFLINTVVATVVFCVLWYALQTSWLSRPPTPPVP
ncbi:MAG: DUF1467 family protein [Alphaproteobacteria bacterium]|nr:DUF1467 family protein [Alphaproteobacteria bacterium]